MLILWVLLVIPTFILVLLFLMTVIHQFPISHIRKLLDLYSTWLLTPVLILLKQSLWWLGMPQITEKSIALQLRGFSSTSAVLLISLSVILVCQRAIMFCWLTGMQIMPAISTIARVVVAPSCFSTMDLCCSSAVSNLAQLLRPLSQNTWLLPLPTWRLCGHDAFFMI